MRTAAVVACLALAAACSKAKDDKKAAGADGKPPAFTVAEKTRNADACKAYIEQACACATAHPDRTDVVDACKYDRSLNDALALSMATADNPASNRTDVLLSQQQARKIATQCIEQLAKLPGWGCEPAPAPTPAPAP